MSNVKVLVLTLLTLHKLSTAEWDYTGSHDPSKWHHTSPTCAAREQSPITIYDGDVIPNAIDEPLEFNYFDLSTTMNMKNDGKAASINRKDLTKFILEILQTHARLSKGGLPEGSYRPVKMVFHWGRDSTTGSEHSINKLLYPMEMQLFSINTKYQNLDEAILHSDGVAALAFLFKVTPLVDHLYYLPITNILGNITTAGTEIPFTMWSIRRLFPSILTEYYQYNGSLTTPPCTESVIWTVFPQVVHISTEQLEKFRSLLNSRGNLISNNYRPLQSSEFITVKASFYSAVNWTYNICPKTAARWFYYYSECGGRNQSPINIRILYSTYDSWICKLTFYNYNRDNMAQYKLKNNGYTAQLEITTTDIGIKSRVLLEFFQTHHVNFHWGETIESGSEHQLNNRSYPLEMQIMSFRRSLRGFQNASVIPGGIAGISVLFEISEQDNVPMGMLINQLRFIQEAGSSIVPTAFSMNSLLPGKMDEMFYYNGSFTIPDCKETVMWLVINDLNKISHRQLNEFRQLKTFDTDRSGNTLNIVNNYRPVQPLNSRTVNKNV